MACNHLVICSSETQSELRSVKVWIELCLNHQWDVLRGSHRVGVRWESVTLSLWFGLNLPDNIKLKVRFENFHVQCSSEKVLHLSNHLLYRDVLGCRIVDDDVDFLVSVWHLMRHFVPVGTKHFLRRHFYFINELVDVHWKSENLIQLITVLRNTQVHHDFWAKIEGLCHHGLNDDCTAPIWVGSDWRASNN